MLAAGYQFQQWDMHKSGPSAILGPNVPPKPVMVMGGYQPPWDILSEEEKASAVALGWTTKEMWEREAMPRITEKLWSAHSYPFFFFAAAAIQGIAH